MGQRFRLATFNLESLGAGADETALADRVAVLRPQLERLRADIVCLQEVNACAVAGKSGPRQPTGLDRVLAGSRYDGFHRVISVGRSGRRPADHHNLAILSRFPVLDHGQVWHDLVPPPMVRPVSADPPEAEARPVEWDRPILWARLDLGRGRVLHVVDVHLRAPRAAWLPGQKDGAGMWRSVGGWAEGFFLATIKRAGQALEARLLVERILAVDPGALVAVCGDCNCGDGEAPLRTLTGDEEDTGNGHLATHMLVPVERAVPDSRRFSVIHHGRRLLLDHLLVSRPLLAWCDGAAIHNETLGDELVSPLQVRTGPDSYHAPVVADFIRPGCA